MAVAAEISPDTPVASMEDIAAKAHWYENHHFQGEPETQLATKKKFPVKEYLWGVGSGVLATLTVFGVLKLMEATPPVPAAPDATPTPAPTAPAFLPTARPTDSPEAPSSTPALPTPTSTSTPAPVTYWQMHPLEAGHYRWSDIGQEVHELRPDIVDGPGFDDYDRLVNSLTSLSLARDHVTPAGAYHESPGHPYSYPLGPTVRVDAGCIVEDVQLDPQVSCADVELTTRPNLDPTFDQFGPVFDASQRVLTGLDQGSDR